MTKPKLYSSLIKAALLLLILFFAGNESQESAGRILEQGKLDLTHWNAEQDGLVPLDGEWAFYWSRLLEPDQSAPAAQGAKPAYIQVPGSWNTDTRYGSAGEGYGYATYRLTIQTDRLDGIYGLSMKSVQTSYRLFVNGKLISSGGMVGTSPSETIARYTQPIALFNYRGTSLDIVLQVANYSFPEGGIDKRIWFGTQEQILRHRVHGLAKDLFLFGSIFIMFLYHMVLYLLRRSNLSALYFSLFCLCISIRTLFVNERYILNVFPDMNWEVFAKISYLTVYAGFPLLLLYIHSLFPTYYSRVTIRIANAVCVLLSAVILVTPASFYHHTLPYFEAFILLMLAAIITKLVYAAYKGEQGTYLVLIGFLNLFLFALNDVLYSYNLSHWGTLIPFGLFVFILLQSMLLSINFSRAFKQIEQLSEKLFALNRSKDEFLANTSHELKTPLQGIIGLAESMSDGAAGPLPETAIHQLQLIRSSGQRLSHLVNDLLDFTKLKQKEIFLQPAVLNVKQACDLVIMLLKPLAERKQMTLRNEIPASCLVFADENRVMQIFSNLLGNAIKFTDSGSVQVEAKEQGNWLQITVRDTGIGIPDEALEWIFEAFEQGDGSLIRQYGGTGIGLSITKKLVELHGGNIWAESSLKQGSAFHFTIPLYECSVPSSAELDTAPSASLKHQTGNQKEAAAGLETSTSSVPVILIVDDDPMVLQVLYNHLTYEGYEVIQADSGKGALHLLNEGCQPHLIVMDLMMPHMSGYELCHAIREKYNKQLPIVILTARNQPSDIALGFERGANDYLIKPVTKTELLLRVKLHLKLASWDMAMEQQVAERTVSIRERMKETAAAMANISAYEERHRIAKEIHDSLGYSLTTTLIQLEAGKSLIADKPAAAVQHMVNSQELLRKGLSDIRNTLRTMKEANDQIPLLQRMERLIQDTEAYAKVTIHSELLLGQIMPNQEQEKVLFHALQEGLTNGIRHGESKTFYFHLSEQDGQYLFKLKNEGKPYRPMEPGIGLHYMKEKVEALGGTFSIDSNNGLGCFISFNIPLPKEDI